MVAQTGFLPAAIWCYTRCSRCPCHQISCRLMCAPSRRHEFRGWDTEYIHQTCDVLEPVTPVTALGAVFGTA
eukprot:12414529-Karenia_brevis.AAC.1